ncbi:Aste57867_12199 [Aphanomyces stellatus]|uniref:Prolyl endopeptidase n=1 Tax=Aphanomyces stellatus TaxID=120398 RepID=A0A485KUY0_9STRA|nr:hypothetical protein As57867_012154 [Aphanomyces stellatus]VFT89053.1 Aste57867_12199 [Aphanomyces stellatus]
MVALGTLMARRLGPSRTHVFRAISTMRKQDTHRSVSTASMDWLRDPMSPKLQEFIESEHAHWKRESKPYRKFQRQVFSEMRRRLKLDALDHSVPEVIGQFAYYLKTIPRLNFPIYCRQDITTGKEEVVLNPNEMDFGQIGVFKVSPDGRYLAYTMDMTGDELYEAYVKDLRSSRITKIRSHVRSIEWDQVGSLYYTVPDMVHRPCRVFRHRMGVSAPDTHIFTEDDPSVFLDVVLTKDMKFVLINANSKRSSEVHSLDATNTAATPQLVRARDPNVLYFADHADDAFYIVTNADQASNYKVVKLPDSARDAGDGAWTTFAPDAPDVKIDEMDLFHEYLVLYERKGGFPRIRILPLHQDASTSGHVIPLDDHPCCVLYPAANRDFGSNTLRFSLSTPLVPEIVYQYHIPTRQLDVLKDDTAAAFDRSQYVCRRVHVPHGDVHVPLTLVHHKDLSLDHSNPTLLTGYGAYGMNLETGFDMEALSLLDRSWVLAFAHVRGGGELGLAWHAQGRGLSKKNTFLDFVACAEWLQAQGYTTAARLAAKGTSAGGLIMGYIANERPDLCRALVMNVPFLDIATTMQDPTLPLTVHEYDEWGNPSDDADVRAYMQSYAPCDNMREKTYPAMLVTTALNDMRVQYWEPLKWVRQLRAMGRKDASTVWCKVRDDGGHFNGLGRLDQLQAAADEVVFLHHALDLPTTPTGEKKRVK